MCGIAGIRRPDGVPADAAKSLLGGLAHRGPDDSGSVSVADTVLGVRRLAIIDVAGGHQPFVSQDGRLAVVGNGEIYNHDVLRRRLEARGHRFRSGSDIEVVLHLYEEGGDGALSELRGMFALAVADGREGEGARLLLVRDRLGIKPLYYALGQAGQVAFASEYKVLLRLPWVQADPDVEALREFAAWGWVAPPRTALTGVRKLGPGQRLVVEGGQARQETWWSRRYPAKGDGRPLAPGDLLDLLDETVAAHLMSEVPLGVFLSGGLDSSMVAALAARHVEGLAAFTVRFSGDPDRADAEAARALAGQLGLRHTELVVDPAPVGVLSSVAVHHDEPVGDVACIPTYLMAAAAREHVTVVLTGEGGDEAFAGYGKYRHLRMMQAARRVPSPVLAGGMAAARVVAGRRRAAKLRGWLGSPAELASLRYDEVFTQPEREALFLDEIGTVAEPVAPSGLGGLDAALFVDSGWPLSEQLTMKLDKMTMAHSLEARVPFLDHLVFEAAAGMPEQAKREKAILREAAARVLPPDITGRRKHGFTVPVGAWLRGELRPLLDELLAPSRLRAQGIWKAAQVEGWCRQHLEGSVDRARQLWNLLAVQLWWEEALR